MQRAERGFPLSPDLLYPAPVTVFRILFGIDALAALVAFYFFAVGINDGSVSSFNIRMWLALLAGLAAILAGGWLLNAKGHRGAACAVLLILALPALGFVLFMLSIVILQPRWN
jgi:hypothetical protein